MSCDTGPACQGGCWGCSGTCSGSGQGGSCSDSCTSSCAICADGCGSGCKGTCDGCSGCGGPCSSSCSGDCDGGCRGCGGSCSYDCTSCSGSCRNTCNNGCTGGEYTRVYINLTLQTLIMADDIIDLKNLIKNEAKRRGLSPLDTPEENRGILAEFQTIDAIITNLKSAGAIPKETQAFGEVMGRTAMLEYIQLAKKLYEANLAK